MGSPAVQKRYHERNKEQCNARTKRFAERNRRIINEAKGVPCHDCEGSFPPYVMEFDHVRGEKLFNIGSQGQGRVERLEIEIAKCDVVCANCHRERHCGRLGNGMREVA